MRLSRFRRNWNPPIIGKKQEANRADKKQNFELYTTHRISFVGASTSYRHSQYPYIPPCAYHDKPWCAFGRSIHG